MKMNHRRYVRSWMTAIGTTAVIALLSGCLNESIVWSPDGERAAVVTDAGLYLCDATGTLSALLVPKVSMAAWLGDSEHLVLAREREVNSWTGLVSAIGEDQAGRIAALADEVWTRLEQGGLWSVIMMGGGGRHDAMKIYLREHHSNALAAKVGNAWSEIEATTVELSEIVRATIIGARVEVGPTLYLGFNEIHHLRPARDGRVLVTVTEMEGDDDFASIYVTRTDGSTTPVLVADRTSAYPDWTPDGRSLVYAQGVGGSAADDDLSLGALVRRQVVDNAGAIAVAEEGEELAGIMFSVFTRVRCMSDGRIIFNTGELCLPLAARDAEVEREQLFALDPARQATLVRLVPRSNEVKLPELLAFFEVSPDEQQLLFGGIDGEVCVLELASGDVEVVQEAGKESGSAPVWREAGELTYHKRTANEVREIEVVLRRGQDETVLSQTWPDDVMADLSP